MALWRYQRQAAVAVVVPVVVNFPSPNLVFLTYRRWWLKTVASMFTHHLQCTSGTFVVMVIGCGESPSQRRLKLNMVTPMGTIFLFHIFFIAFVMSPLPRMLRKTLGLGPNQAVAQQWHSSCRRRLGHLGRGDATIR
jgi:hypothetical protein